MPASNLNDDVRQKHIDDKDEYEYLARRRGSSMVINYFVTLTIYELLWKYVLLNVVSNLNKLEHSN